MNKEVAIIAGGLTGGAVSNGISTLLPPSSSALINVALAIASGFAVTKVTGADTKSNLLKGSLIGSAIVQGLTAIKKFSEKNLSSKLQGTNALSKFAKGAVGLGCSMDVNGLNGTFVGADGLLYQYDESGLAGTFVDEAGNIFESQNGLNAVYQDEFGNVFDDGLNGQFVDDLGYTYDDGLNGEVDIYDEVNGLAGEGFVYGMADEHGLTGEADVYAELFGN